MYYFLVALLFLFEIRKLAVYSCLICPPISGRFCTQETTCSDSGSQNAYNNDANSVSKEGLFIGSLFGQPHYPNMGLLGKRSTNLCFDRCEFAMNFKEHQDYYSANVFDGSHYQCITVQKDEVSLTYDCRIRNPIPLNFFTTKLTTNPTTTAATTTTSATTLAPSTMSIQLNHCSKIDTITHLAHNEIIKNSGLACPDGIHGVSENVLLKLCSAPPSDQWKPGHKVVDNCSQIPTYTAVASFAADIYMHDGLSGVLLECNSTQIKIATEQCSGGVNILHITTNGRNSYTENANSFYTVQW